jgi:hypothetical protein
MGQTTLEGMPEPAVLRLYTTDGQVLRLLQRFVTPTEP